jgi:hypothetical protein
MSAAPSPRTSARKQNTPRARSKATAATGASSTKSKTRGTKGEAGAAKTPADLDKLVRSAAGRYTSADDRFTVESDASGTWYVIDQLQKDDFGLPRLLGPHRTLAAARQAIRFARGK